MSVPVDRLASFPLFAACERRDLAELAERLRHRSSDAGDVVMVEGARAAEFVLLLSGAADIVRADELVAVAGPGAIIGELALLREARRTATVITTAASEFAVGDESDLECLLQLPGVHDAVQALASARLAQDVSPVATTLASGAEVLLRPLLPSDREGYTAALAQMSPASLRHRFFSAGKPSPRLIDYLLHVDFVDHFVWLALVDVDGELTGIGAGRYIRSAPGAHDAEVAFGVVDAHQGAGLGRLLVGAVGVAARAAAIDHLTADVMDDNEPMRALFRKAGATTAFAEPGVVRSTLTPAGAAGLLPAPLQAALVMASRDVVTAAGLALT